jgi:hypothetical protein
VLDTASLIKRTADETASLIELAEGLSEIQAGHKPGDRRNVSMPTAGKHSVRLQVSSAELRRSTTLILRRYSFPSGR